MTTVYLRGGSIVDASGIPAAISLTDGVLGISLATRLDYSNDSINLGAVGGVVPIADFTALASAVRAASTQSADFTNNGYKGIILHLNVSAVPGTDTITPTIDVKDPISGNYKQIYSLGSALSTTGYRAYEIYPGAPSSGAWTAVASGVIPHTWRVNVTHSAGSNFTYSVGITTFI